MEFSDKNIVDIANLARLRLTDSDKIKFKNDLSMIMDWVNSLKFVDVSDVEPLLNVSGCNCPMREDVVCVQSDRESVLMNAPDPDQTDTQRRTFFTVPKVIE